MTFPSENTHFFIGNSFSIPAWKLLRDHSMLTQFCQIYEPLHLFVLGGKLWKFGPQLINKAYGLHYECPKNNGNTWYVSCKEIVIKDRYVTSNKVRTPSSSSLWKWDLIYSPTTLVTPIYHQHTDWVHNDTFWAKK